MVKLVCTYLRDSSGFFSENTRKIAFRAFVGAISLVFLAVGDLAAQPSGAPPAAKAEESAPPNDPPADSKSQEKDEAPAPAPEEKPAKPAELQPETEKPAAETKPETAKKPAIQQLEVQWSEEVAAAAAKKSPEGVEDLRLIQKQVQQVVRHTMPATLGVQVGDAAGSAVIVSPDGLVLTAGHVAGVPGREVNCFFPDGRRVKGITLGMNRAIDSGMIRLADTGPWPYVKLAEESAMKPGEWVVGLGHAGGFDPRRTPPVRVGRVLYQNDEVIHTDCALVGGDSGGPLFNLKGQLVGIHSRIGRRITSNFHVPVTTFRQTWDRLVAGEVWGGRLDSSEPIQFRPTLGLAVQNGEGSCRVTQVFPTGPGKSAGIEVGDIIQEFAGEKVTSTEELTKLLWKQKPNNKVTIQVERSGKPKKIEIRLGQIAQSFPGSPEPPKEEEQDG